MEDLTGRQFGPYRIVEPLGEGGMAAVFKAYQPGVDRFVAVKVLPRQMTNEEQFVERFRQEARLLANLQHPHILPVFDFGEAEGYTYIVMPLIESGTLADRLQGEPLPLADVERIMAQIGDALDYAHGQGLVHRDIKPGNILIDPRGNCLLSDFGIAKLYEGTSHLTGAGGIIGTPAYMSPEQGQGGDVDQRSDIYSLGVVLYEMLTGRTPFIAETPIAVIIKHIHDPLPPPRSLNPSLPPSVEAVVLKALAKSPGDRFASGRAMVKALRDRSGASQHAQTVVDAPPPVIETPALRRYALPLAGLLLLLLALGAGWSVFNGAGSRDATATADQQALLPGDGAVSPTTELRATPATPTPTTPSVTRTPAPSPTATPTTTPEPSATPTVTPTLAAGAIRTNPVDGAQLVFVPEGQFTMGLSEEQAAFLLSICDECRPDHFYASQPQHPVRLDAYWIYQTEVTNAMYAACVGAGSCQPPVETGSNTRADYYGNPAYDDYPVVYVDWFAADNYCRWAGGRLPTDAEWEKAARGDDGRIFPWGDAAPDAGLANVGDRNGDNRPVGSYPQGASPYGVLDMAGNVWEWVADWHDINYYRFSPLENPQGPQSSPEEQRAGRGGNWYWDGAFASAAYHDWWEPEKSGSETGFRCAVDAAP